MLDNQLDVFLSLTFDINHKHEFVLQLKVMSKVKSVQMLYVFSLVNCHKNAVLKLK